MLFTRNIELASDVEHWLADEPVTAYREPCIARLGRWVRRHQTVVATTGALLLTSVIGLSAATFLLGQARQARWDRVVAQVDGLLNAEPQAVPALLASLESTRDDALPRLRELWAQGEQPHNRVQRGRIGLALLPVDEPTVKEWLLASMLRLENPREMLLLRDALFRQRRRHHGCRQLVRWSVVTDDLRTIDPRPVRVEDHVRLGGIHHANRSANRIVACRTGARRGQVADRTHVAAARDRPLYRAAPKPAADAAAAEGRRIPALRERTCTGAAGARDADRRAALDPAIRVVRARSSGAARGHLAPDDRCAARAPRCRKPRLWRQAAFETF